MAAKDANTGTTPALEGSAVDEDRFQYTEQDPPLTGKERQKDINRQRALWRYYADPVYRAATELRSKLQTAERVASGEAAEYQRNRRARKRARMLAVAREYGATLAVALTLVTAAPAVAQEQAAPKCPSLRDVSTVLREQFKEAPIATWLDKPTGDVVTLFAGASGESTTLVISRGECAAVIAEGAMLRTWAIVGGEEA